KSFLEEFCMDGERANYPRPARTEVEGLLCAHENAGSFLGAPDSRGNSSVLPPDFPPRLGPYEILASIGSCGIGQMYRARDSRLGREVALKVLPAELAADRERRERFEREARFWKRTQRTDFNQRAICRWLCRPCRHASAISNGDVFIPECGIRTN